MGRASLASQKVEQEISDPVKEGQSVVEEAAADAGETWPQRLRRWGVELLVLFVLYLVVMWWMTSSMLPNGQTAPAFRLYTLEGKAVSLKDYRGKRVILHFWATWCSACKMNMPIMRAMASGYRDDPVLLTVVSDGWRKQAVRDIAKKKSLNYPILLGNEQLARRYRVNRYPTTYFIDKKGRIVLKDAGVITPFGFWWRELWLWFAGLTCVRSGS